MLVWYCALQRDLWKNYKFLPPWPRYNAIGEEIKKGLDRYGTITAKWGLYGKDLYKMAPAERWHGPAVCWFVFKFFTSVCHRSKIKGMVVKLKWRQVCENEESPFLGTVTRSSTEMSHSHCPFSGCHPRLDTSPLFLWVDGGIFF